MNIENINTYDCPAEAAMIAAGGHDWKVKYLTKRNSFQTAAHVVL